MTLTERFCSEYLEKIFYFCLKKTGNEHCADELASNISFEILKSLERGIKVENFTPWVWAVARNCYGKWATQYYYKDNEYMVDSDEILEYLSLDENLEEEYVLSEDVELLRQSLAFIRSDYRKILVKHYFENKSVSIIAHELSLPIGTVKSKLRNSRKQLKEGMYMARKFGKRSFAPEEISFVNSCLSFGDRGQPWSILEHLMYKNIFLELYENPETAEEMSLEMGIALPYMESELEFLVRETFLTKEGNKYRTAFPIVDKEKQKEDFELAAKYTDMSAPRIIRLLDRYNELCEKHGVSYYGGGQTYEEAKWTLIPLMVDRLSEKIEEKVVVHSENRRPCTPRPDNGCWDIVGYEEASLPHIDYVGLHTMDYEGKRVLDKCFGQYKYEYRGMAANTPKFLTSEETKAMHSVAFGDCGSCELKVLDSLESYGYIIRRDNRYESTVVTIDDDKINECKNVFTDEEKSELHSLAMELETVLTEFRKKSGDCVFFLRERICNQAISSGALKYDDELPKCVGAYIYK